MGRSWAEPYKIKVVEPITHDQSRGARGRHP